MEEPRILAYLILHITIEEQILQYPIRPCDQFQFTMSSYSAKNIANTSEWHTRLKVIASTKRK